MDQQNNNFETIPNAQDQNLEQKSQEIISPEEQELSNFREKEMAKMESGLEKLGKKGYVTIEDFEYDCTVYDGGEGWEEKNVKGCRIQGVIDKNYVEADTNYDRDPKNGKIGYPVLKVNGEKQPPILFRKFIDTYAQFAYNLGKEKKLVERINARKALEMEEKEREKRKEEEQKRLQKAQEILF